MTYSVFTKKYEFFRYLLCKARKAYPLTQSEMATLLRRPQSFVSKYENGERRLDLIEFLEIAKILNIDPKDMIDQLIGEQNDDSG